ncbi:MAG: SelT/SelW/SelH family protein [Pseudomonadota bacterium]
MTKVSTGQAAQKPEAVNTRCVGWNRLLRAGRMAQELLQTLSDDLGRVSLRPDKTGGVFENRLADNSIWERKRDGGFPDAAELKSLVRDHLDPDRNLGHLDRSGGAG